jgi:hypothetical protein
MRAVRTSLRAHRAAVPFAALSAFFATTRAHACPTCAIDAAGATGTTIALAILVVVPFVLTAMIAAFVRRLPPPPGASARFER